jgi:hypothetical protein
MVRLESGVRIRRELVQYAMKRLKEQGISAMSVDAKTVSGARVDLLAYDKQGESTAILCQAMVEPRWVARRASQLRADLIDRIVLCVPENVESVTAPGLEVWQAAGILAPKKITVSGALFASIENLRQTLSAGANRQLSLEDVIQMIYNHYRGTWNQKAPSASANAR